MSESRNDTGRVLAREAKIAAGVESDLGVDGLLEATETGARHSARDVALQVLYAVDLGESGVRKAKASRESRDEDVPSGPASLTRTPRVEAASASKQEEELAESAREVARLEAIAAMTPAEVSAAVFEQVTEHFDVPGSAVSFARALVDGVVERGSQLDELVGQHSRNWRVSRMAAVDRNVLRLAVFELCETQTPVPVVIDEAVDLARRFGSETSPAFVNGILDAIAREVRSS